MRHAACLLALALAPPGVAGTAAVIAGDATGHLLADARASGCSLAEAGLQQDCQEDDACVAAVASLRRCIEALPGLGGSRLEELWATWAQHFAAGPGSAGQLAVFRRNVVDAVVGGLVDPGASYTYFTQHAETPPEELFRPLPAPALPRSMPAPAAQAPDSIDWRSLGFTLPVQDQYMNHTTNCGSCWAYAAIGTMSAAHWMRTKEVVVLSVQQLVDCDHNNETYPVTPNLGCGGGWTSTAFGDLESNGTGLAPASAYPYTGKDGACNVPASSVLAWSRVASYTVLTPDDEDGVAAAIATQGPMSAALDALAMNHYKSGIQDPWFFQCNGANLNHAILIVGYGTENGKKYWRIQNSWGLGWGEEGFYRLVRGRKACGIDQRVAAVKLVDSVATALIV